MFMHGHVHTQFKVIIGTHMIMKLMPSTIQQSLENHFSLKLLHSKATLDLLKISKVYDIYCHSGVRGSSKERCRCEQQVSRCNKLILLHRKMRISLLKQKKFMKHFECWEISMPVFMFSHFKEIKET